MANTHTTLPNDATDPENLPPLRALPRGVQVSVGLLLVVAILAGVTLFERDNRGAVTNPGAALPQVGQKFTIAAFDTNGKPTLTDTAGKPFDYVSLAGHPVWINFWASWCAPCKAEMPDLQSVYAQERVQHPDLVLLLVNVADAREDGLRFARDLHLDGPIVFNDGVTRDVGTYRLTNLPTHILVARDGTVKRILQQSLTPQTATDELRTITG